MSIIRGHLYALNKFEIFLNFKISIHFKKIKISSLLLTHSMNLYSSSILEGRKYKQI